MRKEVVDIVCCPMCKSQLQLQVDFVEHNEIIMGTLTCTKCHVNYPIEQGIPNLLPQKSSVA